MTTPAIPDSLKTKLLLLASTFEKTDRIITGKDVRVAMIFDPTVEAASRTDGKRIEINALRVPDLGSPRTLVTLMGLNYHEDCHVIYSPRISGDFARVIASKGWHYAYNVLEDQRIEALFGARYGSASKYLSAPVIAMIVNNEDLWPTAHILTHGRRYLPLQVREMLKDKFKGDEDLRLEIETVIDRYRKLTFDTPHKFVTASRLVEEFHGLLAKLSPSLNAEELEAMAGSGCASHGLTAGSQDKDQEASASRRLAENDEEQEAAEEEGEDGSGFYGDDEEDDDSEGDDEAGDESGDSDSEDGDDGNVGTDSEDEDDSDEADGDGGSGVGDPVADGEDDGDDDSDHDDEPDEDGVPGSPSGDSGSSGDDDGDDEGDSDSDPVGPGVGGNSLTNEEISDAMNDLLDAVEQDDEVQAQLTKLNDAMNDTSQIDVDFPPARPTRREAPSVELASASRAASNKFAMLYQDLEAGWNYGTDTGRLNVGMMLANPDDRDSWFDEFTPGHTQAAGLEVLLALDVSGSMAWGSNARIGPACEALWVLCRALEEIEATVTVVSFGDRTETVMERGGKADPAKVAYYAANQDDTVPYPTIREGVRVMAASEQPNKLFVIITDGTWSQTSNGRYGTDTRHVDLRSEILKIDATRVYIGINAAAEGSYRDAFDVCASIGDAGALVPVVDSIVEGVLRAAANQ